VKATDVMEHFRKVGAWVDWATTCDQFLHGDPDVEVEGIAIAWIATNASLRRASDNGLNLFITHEPVFYGGFQGMPSREQLVQEKKNLLDESGITLMRCHDTWDRMPEVGIVDAWATCLGFQTEERAVESFYKICLLEGITVEEAARRVRERVLHLGQEAVLVFGGRQRRVERMAVGTGAITSLPLMYELGADLILATDDGMNFWEGGLWARDIDVPVLIVNHCTAEKPGMQAMATYLEGKFSGVPVEYLDVAFPYTFV